MKTQIAALASNISKLQKFDIDYPMDWPEHMYCGITVEGDTPQISFVAQESNREELLGLLGQTFGSHNWIAEPVRYSNFYNWTKTLDNILLTIVQAEEVPPLVKKDVNPKSFPLLLR